VGPVVIGLRRRRCKEQPLVCREFVELITAYLDGTLPESERVRFEAHLIECEGCAAYLDGLRKAIAIMHELPEPPDPATHDALLRAFVDLRGGSAD
jgi:anti-sigma factor RsiW